MFYSSVKYPTAIPSVIEADYHQKVVMKFSLKSESSGELFTPHQVRLNKISKIYWRLHWILFCVWILICMFVLFLQAFVRLTNQKTNQEIFFVAEPEPSKVFKFDLVSGSIVEFVISHYLFTAISSNHLTKIHLITEEYMPWWAKKFSQGDINKCNKNCKENLDLGLINLTVGFC